MRLQSANYAPSKWKYLKMKWENTLYMGMELEMECDMRIPRPAERSDITSMLLTRLEEVLVKLRRTNHFYVKYDGSLTCGVEVVTHPFTLQYAHSKLKLTELASYLHSSESGFITSRNTGLHVHLTKQFFTGYELRKMRAFFKINYTPYLLKFGQRKYNTSYGRLNDTFTAKQFLTAKASTIESIGRESCFAINNNMSPTVEIRLFQSSTNPKRIKAILQFCDALSYYVKEVSLATVLNKNISWATFLEWCKTQNRYAQFLENWKLIDKGKYVDSLLHTQD